MGTHPGNLRTTHTITVGIAMRRSRCPQRELILRCTTVTTATRKTSSQRMQRQKTSLQANDGGETHRLFSPKTGTLPAASLHPRASDACLMMQQAAQTCLSSDHSSPSSVRKNLAYRREKTWLSWSSAPPKLSLEARRPPLHAFPSRFASPPAERVREQNPNFLTNATKVRPNEL